MLHALHQGFQLDSPDQDLASEVTLASCTIRRWAEGVGGAVKEVDDSGLEVVLKALSHIPVVYL